ncbi:MAG: hypothetical protein K2Q01_00210 [Rickettsiales bacterium]|nr:hypothetical protein [Rickettsiales bacterium]
MSMNMQYAVNLNYHPLPMAANDDHAFVSCNWPDLREQLLRQWDRLTPTELESTGKLRLNIARLIQRKYGISVEMVANYLRNFERTLPLL